LYFVLENRVENKKNSLNASGFMVLSAGPGISYISPKLLSTYNNEDLDSLLVNKIMRIPSIDLALTRDIHQDLHNTRYVIVVSLLWMKSIDGMELGSFIYLTEERNS